MPKTSPLRLGTDKDGQVEERDFYQLLQVDPAASSEIISEAYWILVRKTQLLGSREQTAREGLRELNVAYAALINPGLRASYNLILPPSRLDGERSESASGDRQRRPLRQRLLGKLQAAVSSGGRNPYRLLHVDPHADQEVIAAAYACLRQKYKEMPSSLAAEEMLGELAEAFAMVTDSAARASFDADLGRGDEESSPEPSSPSPADGQPDLRPGYLLSEPSLGEPVAEGGAASPATVDWPGLSRMLVHRLGRLLVLAGLGARYGSKHLYRGTRWLAVEVVAPAARRLLAAAGDSVDGLLEWRGVRPLWRRHANLDEPLRARLFANGAPSTQPLPEAMAPANGDQTGTVLARLIVSDGPQAGSAFLVTNRPISIGASPQCDVILDMPTSDSDPIQVRIWRREGRFMIHQIADRERMLIAGKPMIWGVLEDGDELVIGPHRLAFVLTPAEEKGS